MRITTEDILDTDSGVEVEIIDYRTDNCLGSICVNVDSQGKLVITHQVYDEPLDTGKAELKLRHKESSEFLDTCIAKMKTITLRTGSGTPKGTVELVRVTSPTQKTTHNGDGKFTYQQGWDSSGNAYETKSRGGGWRQVKND